MNKLEDDGVNIKELESFYKILGNKEKYIKPSKNSYDKIKVEILMKNISYGIDKCYIKSSKIHGLGVFSKRKIFKDEVITFYPGHWVLLYPSGDYGTTKNGKIGVISSDQVNKRNLEYSENLKNDYSFVIDKYYGICGDNRIYDNPSYLGHMINDGAKGHSKKDNINQKDMDLYNIVSNHKNNAIFKDIGNVGLCIAIIALRDIEPEEEILITYGYGYWIR